VGLAWGVVRLADSLAADGLVEYGEAAGAMEVVILGAVALAQTLLFGYAVALYRRFRVERFGELPEDEAVDLDVPGSAGDGVVKASFVLAFLSFVPPLSILALVLGLLAFRRKRRFVVRAAIACGMGGFFTAAYVLIGTGMVISRSRAPASPGYAFLGEVDAGLGSHVRSLEDGLFMEVRQQLEGEMRAGEEQSWAFHCALGIARFETGDTVGAMWNFRRADVQQPERSEFYYYFGRVLLSEGEIVSAGEKLELSLRHEPKLDEAEDALALVRNAYVPTPVANSICFVVILLLLFTLHEYAHGYSAWRLGDDTAKNEGRLTLNPIPHLDLFGSLILPGILLWRQSEFLFGWAKPVPVNSANFSNPRRDDMVVSFAGPAMNLGISMVCVLILAVLALVVRVFWPESQTVNFAAPAGAVSIVGPPYAPWIAIVIAFLKQLLFTSLILACFNLIPVPPLDGSWILRGMVSDRIRDLLERIRPYGFVVMLAIVFTPIFRYVLIVPIDLFYMLLQACGMAMGFA
jgi:Zn-dependent protease